MFAWMFRIVARVDCLDGAVRAAKEVAWLIAGTIREHAPQVYVAMAAHSISQTALHPIEYSIPAVGASESSLQEKVCWLRPEKTVSTNSIS